jgi:hypothetical protein
MVFRAVGSYCRLIPIVSVRASWHIHPRAALPALHHLPCPGIGDQISHTTAGTLDRDSHCSLPSQQVSLGSIGVPQTKKRSAETEAAPATPAKGPDRTAQGPTLPFGSAVQVLPLSFESRWLSLAVFAGSSYLTHTRHSSCCHHCRYLAASRSLLIRSRC